jgi:ABC-2 type transport system permease protein
MRPETFRRVVVGRRKSLIGWAIGFLVTMAFIVLLYPAVRDQPSFTDLMEDYPEFVQQILGLGGGLDMGSPEGYLNSQLFANTLPILFLIFLMAFAVRETAGEETEKTLNLALAHPIRRERFILEKFAAMTITGLGLAIVGVIGLMVFGPLVDMELSVGGYVGATLSVFLIALVFATLALAIGASTGKKSLAYGVTSTLAVAFYLLWGLAPIVDAIEITNAINPFFWGLAGVPIVSGLQVGNALLLTGAVAVLAAGAVWGLKRRDIGV